MLYKNLIIATNQKFIIGAQKRERNPNITLKPVIKSQGKSKKENERNRNNLQKQPPNK